MTDDQLSIQYDKPIVEDTREYPIHTSQEVDAIMRAACDGKSGRNYHNSEQSASRTHQVPGSTHFVQLQLTDAEISAGATVAALEELTGSQDSDVVFIIYYVARILAPASPLPARMLAGGWIDFDRIIDSIGWYPQTTSDRRKAHAKIWSAIKYGERAIISGARTTTYIDPETKREISTSIHGAVWRVMKTETLDGQKHDNSEHDDVPIRVELAMSRELTALISGARTAQYLPMGETLAAIPGGKAAGAWAKVMGLAIASFWRRQPHAALSSNIKPTRRELLDRFQSKIAPSNEVLAGNNPSRAIENFANALGILAESGFIDRKGEVLRDAKEIRESLPRKNWQKLWLDEAIEIYPDNAKMRDAIVALTKSLPEPKPKNLQFRKAAKR